MKTKGVKTGLMEGRRPGETRNDETRNGKSWRRNEFYLGTWNVLSLYRAGALRILLDQIDKYKIGITAIQEIRWTGQGVLEKRDHTIFYSCDKRQHEFGVGFVVKKNYKHLVMDFKAVSTRICTLRIKGKFFNYTIINVHAPTEVSSEEEKESFYDLLQKIYEKSPSFDVKIVIGDMNAQVGKEEMYYPTIGKQSLHEKTNDNGYRLIQFATLNNMMIGSTMFQHRNIHKPTWTAPDRLFESQIDHMVIDARHMSDLLDVRSYRGGNVDSDHYLVIARMRARISNIKKIRGERVRKFCISKLQDETTINTYMKRLEENLEQPPCSGGETIQDEWDICKSTIQQVAEEVLGRQAPRQRNEWFDKDCERATNEKNEAYLIMQQHSTRNRVLRYQEKRREEKKIHKKRKREWEKKQLEELQDLYCTREARKLYSKVKETKKEFKPRVNICKAKDGSIICDQNEVLMRWNEHFDELFNKNNNQEDIVAEGENIQFTVGPTAEETDLPTLEELEEAIKKLKNNKAPGADGITAELFKQGGTQLKNRMHRLILRIWVDEELPHEWNFGIICPILKKGDPMTCSNYRGISLLNTAYKIFSYILYARLSEHTERIIGRYQCGFRKGKSTTNQIFTVSQIMEKTVEYQIGVHHLFIDFKSAYDSIYQEKLLYAMTEFGIPLKLIRLVQATMTNVQCSVQIQSRLSEPISITRGVRQGDALACLLFNIALEKVIRDSGIQTRGTIFFKTVQILAYADDIDLMARTTSGLSEALLNLEKSARNMGLAINQEKTVYMYSGKDTILHQNLAVGNYVFKRVDSFKYLGTMINKMNNRSVEVNARLTMANRAYYGLQNHLKSRIISRNTKTLLYKTLIRPVLTYGAETWVLSKQDEHRLSIFERKILRKIYGPVMDRGSWRIRTNQELYQLCGENDIVKFCKLSRLRWAGHVIRQDDDDLSRRVLLSEPGGKRPRGRPRLRWEDGVEEDVARLGCRNWKVAALNRKGWRKLLKEAEAHPGL